MNEFAELFCKRANYINCRLSEREKKVKFLEFVYGCWQFFFSKF